MTDIPTIMSAAMVRALIREAYSPGDGKTETRRLLYTARKMRGGVVPKNLAFLNEHRPIVVTDPVTHFPTNIGADQYFALTGWHKVKAGDRLWCRENVWLPEGSTNSNGHVTYQADHGPDKAIKWSPSIHMPRWASRLTLHATASARIERLQDIDEQGAANEGIVRIPRSLTRDGRMDGYGLQDITPPGDAHTTRVNAYRRLWERLHGPTWDVNPWVVVIQFRPVLANIDSKEAKAAA